MHSAQGSYNHEEEIRGIHVSMGNAETKSNGHIRKVERVNLSEIMRSHKWK